MMRQLGDEYAKRILNWTRNGVDDSGILRIMEDMTRDIVAVLELNDITMPAITTCLAQIVKHNEQLMRTMDDGNIIIYEALRKMVGSETTTVTVKREVSLDD